MSNLYQLSLFNKILLLNNRPQQLSYQPAPQPGPLQITTAMHPTMIPTFQIQDHRFATQNTLIPMHNGLTSIRAGATGKHSCTIRPPTLGPTPMHVANQSIPTNFINFNVITPPQQVIEEFPHDLSREALMPSLNLNSKKINKQTLIEIPKKKKKAPAAKKIVFLPKKKKSRKFASQVVRAFKCTAIGCTKAYGCENSLKVHVKNKHKTEDFPKGDDEVTLKTEDNSPN